MIKPNVPWKAAHSAETESMWVSSWEKKFRIVFAGRLLRNLWPFSQGSMSVTTDNTMACPVGQVVTEPARLWCVTCVDGTLPHITMYPRLRDRSATATFPPATKAQVQHYCSTVYSAHRHATCEYHRKIVLKITVYEVIHLKELQIPVFWVNFWNKIFCG